MILTAASQRWLDNWLRTWRWVAVTSRGKELPLAFEGRDLVWHAPRVPRLLRRFRSWRVVAIRAYHGDELMWDHDLHFPAIGPGTTLSYKVGIE